MIKEFNQNGPNHVLFFSEIKVLSKINSIKKGNGQQVLSWADGNQTSSANKTTIYTQLFIWHLKCFNNPTMFKICARCNKLIFT